MKVKRNLDLLKEVITLDNIEPMSEMIAICGIKKLMRFTTIVTLDMYKNLYRDIHCKNNDNYVLSDSYDLVQDVALVLVDNVGKHLNDFHHISKKGKKLSIEEEAERRILNCIERIIRRKNSDIDIDNILNYNCLTYEVEDDKRTYITPEEYKKGCENVSNIIDSLNLNVQQKTVLQCRLDGLSFPQIAILIGRALSTTYECWQKIGIRYMDTYQ